jgi:aminopeptidase N
MVVKITQTGHRYDFMHQIQKFAGMATPVKIRNLAIQWGILCFLSIPGKPYAQETREAMLAEISVLESKAATTRLQALGNQSSASQNTDIHHYRCEWILDPAVRFINGKVTPSFRLRESASSVSFDLVDSLRVDSVLFGGSPVSFSRPGNHTLKIDFPSALAAGTLQSLTICYQGVPPSGQGFGTFALSKHAGTPVLWTLSEPFGSMEWWPCKNGLDDKADSIDIILTTPEAYTGVSNGMIHSETVSGGYRTVSWKHRYPVATYLVAIAATNYTTLYDSVTLGNRVMPIIQHAYPESANAFRNAAALTGRTLKMLHDRFGDYPFINERYGHTQFSWGGGMEHQTNSFMYNTNETLIVHEAAHQWFGNLVTCGSWQDIWLNEGFALFTTNYSLELHHPAATLMNTLRVQLNSIVSQPGGSVFVDDTTSVGRIFNARLTYFKGGWVAQMLRWKLGDSAFFRGMRAYLQDPALRYGYARSADLQRNLEAKSGQDLDGFFADWLYGQGYPSYQLAWTPVGNGLVQTSLSQTVSHPSVDFFEMPVPIRFKNAFQDTIIIIDHRQQAQTAYHRLAFMPDSAFIDPQMKLISAGNRVERKELPPSEPNTAIVYPNPVGNSFNVSLRNFQEGTLTLAIHNSIGQLVWREQRNNFSGNDIIQVSSDKLAGGIYLLSIQSGNDVRVVRKIMK